MKIAKIWLDKIDYFLTIIAAGTIFLMMIWIFLDVILRYFFNKPITGTMEFTGEYLLVTIVFFALSYTHKEREHVNVDILYNKFSPRAKRISSLITNVISLIAFIILFINNFNASLTYFEKDIRSTGLLDYPLAPAMVMISLGILLLSARILIELIETIFSKVSLEQE